MQAVTAVTISGAMVFGMVLALLGSLKLALAKRLDVGETRVGGLLAALNLSLIPMMLFSGVLLDEWGARPVLIAGSLVLALAVLSLGARPTYTRAFVAVLFAGLGAAMVSTASLVLMPRAFFPTEPAASLNLGNIFVALGALITPALTDALLRTMQLRRTVAVLAFLCLIPAFLAAVPDREQLALAGEQADLLGLLGHEHIWLAGLVFFFYAPLEGAISIWTTTYLTDLGHGERRAAWLLSGFWTLFLTARLLTALLLHTRVLHPGWMLVLPALLAAVVLGNLSGTAERGHARAGLLVLGLLLGPIFPTLIGLVFSRFPQEMGTAYGSVFAIGSAGSLFLAPLIGASARRGTVQTALRIPLVLALLLTACALVYALLQQP
jgi:fucose permease